MLKRKWIIDNQGRLAGVWTACEAAVEATRLNEQPVLAAASVPKKQRGARRRWFRRARMGEQAAGLHKAAPGLVSI